jgi:hypothetical protein
MLMGQEIAGFVLAAIPLMISALEHYRDTAEVLKGWWKVKTEYRKCVRSLNYPKIAFKENLEELFLPLVADDEMVQRLLSCPGGKDWNDPGLEEFLEKRMPKAYLSYLDTMESMMETVQRREEVLGMNKIHFRAARPKNI